MIHLDLFSGIGGFAYAVDQVWPGAEHIFCEYDPDSPDDKQFCQQVIKKHWKGSTIYGDIRRLITDTENQREGGLRLEWQPDAESTEPGGADKRRINLVTGGFPCQSFSQAGQRRGIDDDRYLWPEMFRIIQFTKPEWVIAENVRGIITWEQGMVFEQVCSDLEAEGYEVQPFIIPAVAVNAPHRRDRVWFVAHAIDDGQGRTKRRGNDKKGGVSKINRPENDATGQSERTAEDRRNDRHDATPENSVSQRSRGRSQNRRQVLERQSAEIQNEGSTWESAWIEVATELCSVDDGLSARMGDFTISKSAHRTAQIRGYGNAIVPQVAMQIMYAIREAGL